MIKAEKGKGSTSFNVGICLVLGEPGQIHRGGEIRTNLKFNYSTKLI